jgi:hypothetical protein
MRSQRVILDAALEGSVIRGTLTPATGERREFHGWLELNTALERALHAGAAPAHSDRRDATSANDPQKGPSIDDQPHTSHE